MTVLVAARCVDGVVVGADSISTSAAGAQRVMQIPSDDKIKIVGDRVIIAGTGAVGLGQRFLAVVEKCWRDQAFNKQLLDCAKTISGAAVHDFNSTGTPLYPNSGYGFGALVAAPVSERPELIEFGLADMQPEVKTSRLHFVSMGSGQVLADPFIAFVSRVLWKNTEPDVKLAKFGVYWAIQHAIKHAPGGVGEPIQMAVLRRVSGKWRASLLTGEELGELAQHIDGIEGRIAEYPDSSISSASSQTVPLP